MIYKYSLHQFVDFDSVGFDKTQYSLFKYGSAEAASKMGIALGKAFTVEFFEKNKILNINEKIAVFPSSYGFIPSAANSLKDFFLQELNLYLIRKKSVNICDYGKIQRYTHYKQDYASLSYEDRVAITSSDVFYIDAEFVKDKTLIFIDDIKITGRHEELIEATLEKAGLKDCKRIHVYFAELLPGNTNPSIESMLNGYCHPSIENIGSLAKTGLILNTRIIKFLLSSIQNVSDFMEVFPKHYLIEMYQKSVCEGYYTYPQYKESLAFIKSKLEI